MAYNLTGLAKTQAAYKNIANPLTPGQMATGQLAGSLAVKQDNATPTVAAEDTPKPPTATQPNVNPNTPGISTGAKSAAQSAVSDIGLGSISTAPVTAQTETPPEAPPVPPTPTAPKPQPSAQSNTGASSAIPTAVLEAAKVAATTDTLGSSTTKSGEPINTNIPYGNGATAIDTQAIKNATPAIAAQDAAADPTANMTPAEKYLWDLYTKGGGLSEQERQAKIAAAKAAYNQLNEKLNRMQGATGGKSALETLGEAQSAYQYGQNLGSIEGEAFNRQMQQLAQAQNLASEEAARTERTSSTWDKYKDAFNQAGYTLGYDGTVYDSQGNKVDNESLKSNPDLYQQWQSFMYETAKERESNTTAEDSLAASGYYVNADGKLVNSKTGDIVDPTSTDAATQKAYSDYLKSKGQTTPGSEKTSNEYAPDGTTTAQWEQYISDFNKAYGADGKAPTILPGGFVKKPDGTLVSFDSLSENEKAVFNSQTGKKNDTNTMNIDFGNMLNDKYGFQMGDVGSNGNAKQLASELRTRLADNGKLTAKDFLDMADRYGVNREYAFKEISRITGWPTDLIAWKFQYGQAKNEDFANIEIPLG